MDGAGGAFKPEIVRSELQRDLMEMTRAEQAHVQVHRNAVGGRRAVCESERMRVHAEVEAERTAYADKLKALQESKVLEVQLAMAQQQAKSELRGMGRKRLVVGAPLACSPPTPRRCPGAGRQGGKAAGAGEGADGAAAD